MMLLCCRPGDELVHPGNLSRTYGSDTDGTGNTTWGSVLKLLVAARDAVFAGQEGSPEHAFLHSLLQRLGHRLRVPGDSGAISTS